MSSWAATARDLFEPIKHWDFWVFMGKTDIKYKYKRTLLGPFWLTLTNAAYIFMLALVFGALFRTTDPTYVPWVASGVIVWNFIGAALREGSIVYFEKRGFLLQTGAFKPAQLVYWVIWRNVQILAHQLPIILVTIAFFHVFPDPLHALWLVPGFLLQCFILLPACLILGLLTARLRDLEPLVATALMALFFVTPIMWQPEQLGDRYWLATWNPVTYIIELVRAPLLGKPIRPLCYGVCGGLALMLWVSAIYLYRRFATRLPFWV